MKTRYSFMIASVFLIVPMLMVSSVEARKKKTDVNEMDVDELRELVISLQDRIETQGKTMATLQNQVNEVVNNMQRSNGMIGSNEKKNMDQDKLLRDASQRLQVLEDKGLSLMTQMQELKNEGFLKPKSAKNYEEYTNYSYGLENFNSMDYEKAVADLKDFQKKFDKSIYWSYAQFWIAESYYMQSDYLTAIQEYQELLKKRPKSSKAPLAMYRQGLSFVQLQSFEDARAFFTKLTKTYPKSLEAVIAKGQIARIDEILKLKEQQEMELNAIQ